MSQAIYHKPRNPWTRTVQSPDHQNEALTAFYCRVTRIVLVVGVLDRRVGFSGEAFLFLRSTRSSLEKAFLAYFCYFSKNDCEANYLSTENALYFRAGALYLAFTKLYPFSCHCCLHAGMLYSTYDPAARQQCQKELFCSDFCGLWANVNCLP